MVEKCRHGSTLKQQHLSRRTPPFSGEGVQEVECDHCGLDPICQLFDYGKEGGGLPDGILLRRQPVRRGETIFRAGDPFRSIFAVKSGSFKTLIPSPEGGDQVIGFHLAGELLGSEGVAGNTYTCTARALELSAICEVRLERLPDSGRSMESLQQGIITLLGQEIAFRHTLGTTMIRQSGDQRLASFLLTISHRLIARGMSGAEFNLNMSRTDIGSYLGLASETVSRILMKFQNSGALTIRRKHIRLDDHELLECFAG